MGDANDSAPGGQKDGEYQVCATLFWRKYASYLTSMFFKWMGEQLVRGSPKTLTSER